mmetsp:Transcript_67361/g.119087  ORF Transcript_67361/g.119087 Transcript_67361/m.119087 type:complete len:113 (+) Transcript_67361:290-628(+)
MHHFPKRSNVDALGAENQLLIFESLEGQGSDVELNLVRRQTAPSLVMRIDFEVCVAPPEAYCHFQNCLNRHQCRSSLSLVSLSSGGSALGYQVLTLRQMESFPVSILAKMAM